MKSLLRILTGLMLLVVIPIAIFAFFPKLAEWANQQPWIQTLYMFFIGIAAFALFSGLDLLNRVQVFKSYVGVADTEKENYWKQDFSSERLGFLRSAISALLLLALIMVLLVFNLMVLPKAPQGDWYLWSIKALGVAIAIGVIMILNGVLFLDKGKKVILGIHEKPLVGVPKAITWQDRLFQIRPSFLDAEVDLKEDFDGISELDNPPPPWFMFLFYGSIVFAGIYLVHYAVLKNGLNPTQEYLADDAARKAGAKIYLAKHEGNVDETNVTLQKDKGKLADAGQIFVQRCAACHGEKGEGKNGPNLTDAYWIHGNSIKEVFATIKNGVLEKGMVAWKDQISPPNMRAVASYVLSLQGSKPAGEKEPQGDKLEMKEKF